MGNAFFRSVFGFVWSWSTVTGYYSSFCQLNGRLGVSPIHTNPFWKDHSPFPWPDPAPSNLQHSYRNYLFFNTNNKSIPRGHFYRRYVSSCLLPHFVTPTSLPLQLLPVYMVSLNWRSQNFCESSFPDLHCGYAPQKTIQKMRPWQIRCKDLALTRFLRASTSAVNN